MVSLLLMYVYYDKNGDIKAITPSLDVSLSDQCAVATFPLTEVEAFLTGQKKTFDYTVKKIQRAVGESFKISRKEYKINLARSLENYITQVSTARDEEPILTITAYLGSSTIKLEIDPLFKDLLDSGHDAEEDVQNFINHPSSALYFTRKNNPYHLLHTLVYKPRVLLDSGSMIFELKDTIDLSNSSVYTKKIVASYGYKIRGRRNVV
jgi:hypothetical protein